MTAYKYYDTGTSTWTYLLQGPVGPQGPAGPSGAGTGDVNGPASAVNNNVAVFDLTTGKLIKDGGKGLPSGAIVGDTDTQTLSGKTLSAPVFSGSYSFGGTPTFPTFNQNTTGSAATLTTARDFQTNLASTSAASFNGSANNTHGVTGILPGANGGTGNGFFAVTGPTTALRTFTFPNATATVLTSNAAVTVAQGGTGRASNTAYALIAGNTTTTGAHTSIANGATGTVLKGAGTSAYPAFGTLASTDLTDVATLATLTGVQIMTNKTINGATPTEVSYLSGVTSAVQTQLGAKVNTGTSPTNNQMVAFSDSTGNNIKSAGFSTGSVILTSTASISGASWLNTSISSATDKAISPSAVNTHQNATTGVHGVSGTIVGTSDIQTLTNKRVTKRVGTTASSSTPTPNADANDMYTVTALAANATFGAPTGTPTDGQSLVIRIKDNATARTLAWNAAYRAVGSILPTTTVTSKTMYLAFIYNSADSKWDMVAYNQEV